MSDHDIESRKQQSMTEIEKYLAKQQRAEDRRAAREAKPETKPKAKKEKKKEKKKGGLFDRFKQYGSGQR